jgi:hypothetical protein
MNEQEWTNALNRLEKDEIGPPDMVWRSADGTDWPTPGGEEQRDPIYLWPGCPEKRVMELKKEELQILADAHRRAGARMTGGHATPEDPSKDQG